MLSVNLSANLAANLAANKIVFRSWTRAVRGFGRFGAGTGLTTIITWASSFGWRHRQPTGMNGSHRIPAQIRYGNLF